MDAPWGCPACHRPLRSEGDGWRCDGGHGYRRHGAFPLLLMPEEEPLLEAARRYADAWVRTGWAPPPGLLADLPYVKGKAWAPKARSLEALAAFLGPGAGRVLADVGAGTGWLSLRMAASGFRCVATDVCDDVRLGLAALSQIPRPPVEAAYASLTRWPLRDASLDVAVCNASLHYVPDEDAVLAEAVRTLRPGGVLAVMNSPVHRDRRSAERAAADFRRRMEGLGAGPLVRDYRHFVAEDLEASLRRRFEGVRRIEPAYGVGFRLSRAAKGIGLRMELASFPILTARRPASPSA